MDPTKTTLWLGILFLSIVAYYSRIKKTKPYRYSPLVPEEETIHLLRLFPSRNKNAVIDCQLFSYSTRNGSHLYEALFYVWGDSEETVSITIDKHPFMVSKNLHAALSRLRNHSLERVIWVDAICINQTDEKEKAQQIQSMVKIYSQASRVAVWLGKAESNQDHQVLEELRMVARKGSANFSRDLKTEKKLLSLLKRPWFQRIWVRR